MAEEITDENVRRMTQKLIDVLRIEHPEQEYEPEGLQIRDEIDLNKIEPRSHKKKIAITPARKPAPKLLAYINVGEFDLAAKRNAVINRLALEYNVDASEILGDRRFANVIAARKRAYKELRDMNWSLPQIGRMMNRDHSTVLSGIRSLAP